MKLVGLGLILVTALVGCSHHTSDKERGKQQAKLLVDRNWMDVMPQTEREKLHVYRFVPSMGGGVYQDRTIFKGTFELFKFAVDGDHIDFDLLETHDKVRSQYQIDTVAGPKPFDLKLTIWSDPRGPHQYYGIRAEHDPDGQGLERELAAIATLRH